jgi:hypothetical protein
LLVNGEERGHRVTIIAAKRTWWQPPSSVQASEARQGVVYVPVGTASQFSAWPHNQLSA